MTVCLHSFCLHASHPARLGHHSRRWRGPLWVEPWQEQRRPDPHPYPPWLQLEGARQGPAHSGLSCRQETLTRRKGLFALTVLGGGCARDQQAHQTHTPHLEKLPNPRGLQVLVLVFSHLLCFHEACELWGDSREAHNLGAAGFSSAVELYFASGLTLGAALCAGGPTTPLSGSSFSRTSNRGWMWCWAWLAQGATLPNPWSPPEGAFTEFPGTFHRKGTGPAQHRAGFVSPSW